MKTINSFSDHATIAVSDLTDGNMRAFDSESEPDIIQNQLKFSQSLNVIPEHTLRLCVTYESRQSFTEYLEVTPENLDPLCVINPEKNIPVYDGLVTTLSQIAFFLPLADCLGIVVVDEQQHIIGLLHAGRQNIEQNGPAKFIEFFQTKFGSHPAELKVFLSPCARNYQIYAMNNQKLPDAAKAQLQEAGVAAANIIDSEIDTVTNPNYPSHSSGDKKLRFAIATKLN